jgi:predicted nucleic acid-binding protein
MLLYRRTTNEVRYAVFCQKAAQIAAALNLPHEYEGLVLQGAETGKAAMPHYQLKPALGFSDWLVLEVARKAGHLPLGTFDKAPATLADT